MGSNLLYKASIVTTPTAYGVGVLNSIKPAIPFGEELIVNGSFDTDSNWTKGAGWSISGGKAIKTSGTGSALSQTVSTTTVGKKYKFTFDAIVTSGVANAELCGVTIPNFTTTGTQEHTITATSTSGVEFYAASNFAGSISNVSVKEQIDADFDFTRNSSATRVNPDYLIEDVSILSSNLVQNGNFSELGSQLVTNGDFESNIDNWAAKDCTIVWDNGKLKCDNSSGNSNGGARQNVGLQNSKTYKLVATVQILSADSNGIFNLFTSSAGGTGQSTVYTGSALVAGGEAVTETAYFTTGTDGDVSIQFSVDVSNAIYTIDNVSVKQVDPNDNWTLGTGWSIGTNKAISDSTVAFQSLTQVAAISNSNGKTFKVKFTISDYQSGGVALYISGFINNSFFIFANGEYAYDITVSSGTSGNVEFLTNSNGFKGSVSNISVIEVQQTDIPRLDYTNGTASILLEPQSTNSFPNSEDYTVFGAFSNGTGTNPVITSNYSVSPDGTQNADRIQFNRGSGTSLDDTSYVDKSLSLGTIDATLSIYLKTNDGTTKDVTLRLGAGLFDYDVIVTSEWKRFALSGNTSVDRVQILLYGNRNSQTADLSCFGTQVEALSYATSYIPTSGSTITRAAETLNNAGNSDLFNDSAGALYFEGSVKATNENLCISINDGTTSNRVELLWFNDGNFYTQVGNSGQTSILSNTDNNKIAIGWGSGVYYLYLNGSVVITDTFTSLSGLKSLDFKRQGGFVFYGKCKTIAVFNEALSDTELACLTSTNNREIFLNYYYRMQYVGANTEAIDCAQIKLNV